MNKDDARRRPHSVNPRAEYERYLRTHADRLKTELPKLLKKIQALEHVLENKEALRKSTVNVVWKQKELLRNYRDAVEKHKIGAEFRQLETAAVAHQEWLRSMVGKQGADLTPRQIQDVREWLQVQKRRAARLQSGDELNEYTLRVMPLVLEYEREVARVMHVVREMEKAAAEPFTRPSMPMVAAGAEEDSEYSVAGGHCSTLEPYLKHTEVDNNLKDIANRFLMAAGRSGQTKPCPGDLSAEWKCGECRGALEYDAKECVATCVDCGVCRADVQLWDGSRPFGQQTVITPYWDMNRRGWNRPSEGSEEVSIAYQSNASNREKETHFEWRLKSATAQLCKKIDPEIEKMFWEEARRRGYTVMTRDRARQILKTLNMQQHYGSDATLAKRFSEQSTPMYSDEQIVRLREMFRDALILFQKCPLELKQRTNFPYNYFFYQASFMNGWDDFLPCFPLPDGQDVLRHTDNIWKWICENKTWGNRWSFYPTI